MVDLRRSGHRRILGFPRAIFVLLCVAVAVIVAVAIFLSSLQWTGPHVSPVANAILGIVIIDGPVPTVVYSLAVVGVLFLLFRRPTRRRVFFAVLALAGGGVVGLAIFLISSGTEAFGLQLHWVIGAWAVVAFAALALAAVSFRHASAPRRLGNIVVILLVIVAGVIGVNADFGLDPTIATLAGLSTQRVLVIPTTTPPATTTPVAAPLYKTWLPPADLPKVGKLGQVTIPGILSGFKARPAGLYLPPAALVKNPPALPLVIMMMGEPGNPDPIPQATVLDKMAAHNKGLAPIVLVADQLGDPFVDSLCLNTKQHGNVEKYITEDVVNWARTHLHVLQDPASWTVAGYSSGGECAVSFGAKYPNTWGNVLDISGEAYPGWGTRSEVAATVFHGSWAAYSATWPVNLLAGRRYANTVGIFTVGSDDNTYRPQAIEISNAARAAGWKSTYFEVVDGGHGDAALIGGLKEGYAVLYPRLGLSAPSATK
jgi:enterochelin esterase-like enzyme/uncharacterized membrane protein